MAVLLPFFILFIGPLYRVQYIFIYVLYRNPCSNVLRRSQAIHWHMWPVWEKNAHLRQTDWMNKNPLEMLQFSHLWWFFFRRIFFRTKMCISLFDRKILSLRTETYNIDSKIFRRKMCIKKSKSVRHFFYSGNHICQFILQQCNGEYSIRQVEPHK